MDEEYKKSYRTEPTIHRIHVFHINTSYRYFHMSCNDCKLQDKCFYIKHKREICAVSKQTEKLLSPFTWANVSSFGSSEFYVSDGRKSKKIQRQLRNIFDFITIKYIKKYNGK